MNTNQNIINELFSFDDIVDEFELLLEKEIEPSEAFKEIEKRFGKERMESFLKETKRLDKN